jgi:aspartyl-tRNA synthetase
MSHDISVLVKVKKALYFQLSECIVAEDLSKKTEYLFTQICVQLSFIAEADKKKLACLSLELKFLSENHFYFMFR